MTIPFEQRVFPVLYPTIGRRGSLVVICPSSSMTPELVERLVVEAEAAIGEPVRHSIRKLFPKKLDCTIAEEVARVWKLRKGVLMLCNPLSRPTQLKITANRFPRVPNGVYPADYAIFSIDIDNAAPRALDLLARLPTFARLSNAFLARANSPNWAESVRTVMKERGLQAQSLIPGFRFLSEDGWGISEWFGWGTYIGPRCAQAFGPLHAPEVIEHAPDGSATIWLTKAPFDFREDEHLRRYNALKAELAGHLHPGTQIGEF